MPTEKQLKYWKSLEGKPSWNKGLKGVMPVPYNKGTHITNSGSFKKGHKQVFFNHTDTAKEQMRKLALGKIILPAQREKARINGLGKKQSEELKIKRGIYKRGIESPNFKGEISLGIYPEYWTETLRRSIRERDNYVCQLCSLIQGDITFSVHHIDYDKKNCNPTNLITLCRSCHTKTNNKRDYWTNYFKKND